MKKNKVIATAAVLASGLAIGGASQATGEAPSAESKAQARTAEYLAATQRELAGSGLAISHAALDLKVAGSESGIPLAFQLDTPGIAGAIDVAWLPDGAMAVDAQAERGGKPTVTRSGNTVAVARASVATGKISWTTRNGKLTEHPLLSAEAIAAREAAAVREHLASQK